MTDLKLDPEYDHPDHREMALKHLQSADSQHDARIMEYRVAQAQVFAILDLAAAYREHTELLKPVEMNFPEINIDGIHDPASVTGWAPGHSPASLGDQR